jgi:hypothetical protein
MPRAWPERLTGRVGRPGCAGRHGRSPVRAPGGARARGAPPAGDAASRPAARCPTVPPPGGPGPNAAAKGRSRSTYPSVLPGSTGTARHIRSRQAFPTRVPALPAFLTHHEPEWHRAHNSLWRTSHICPVRGRTEVPPCPLPASVRSRPAEARRFAEDMGPGGGCAPSTGSAGGPHTVRARPSRRILVLATAPAVPPRPRHGIHRVRRGNPSRSPPPRCRTRCGGTRPSQERDRPVRTESEAGEDRDGPCDARCAAGRRKGLSI